MKKTNVSFGEIIRDLNAFNELVTKAITDPDRDSNDKRERLYCFLETIKEKVPSPQRYLKSLISEELENIASRPVELWGLDIKGIIKNVQVHLKDKGDFQHGRWEWDSNTSIVVDIMFDDPTVPNSTITYSKEEIFDAGMDYVLDDLDEDEINNFNEELDYESQKNPLVSR